LSILEPGLTWLEEKTGKPVLGVLPYLSNLRLDQEDAIDNSQDLAATNEDPSSLGRLKVKVPVFPRISNHTDFDGLRMHPQVDLEFIGEGGELSGADLIILPGSKSVRADLQWLKDQGFADQIARHLRYGGKLLGICGGFQMLGKTLFDAQGIEGSPGESEGLGLLDISTELAPEKILKRVSGALAFGKEAQLEGYEIHCGRTTGAALRQPFALVDGEQDGVVSEDGNILGTYIHGLFDKPDALDALLQWAGLQDIVRLDRAALRESELNRLADMLESHMDWTKFTQATGLDAPGADLCSVSGV
jgi:adenosylcobyric acid synthase